MQQKHFDDNLVTTQLKHSGLLAILQLLNAGFTFRMNYNDIVDICMPLLPSNLPIRSNHNFCYTILNSLGVEHQNIRLGKTRIFYRSEKKIDIKQEMENSKNVLLINEEMNKKTKLYALFKTCVNCVVFYGKSK